MKKDVEVSRQRVEERKTEWVCVENKIMQINKCGIAKASFDSNKE